MNKKLKKTMTAALLAALALLPPLASFADAPDFTYKPVLAGKALLTEPGFAVRRELGVASLAPELRIPEELVYKSNVEKSGAFGFAWRCPQLESSVKWSAGSLIWTTPWGEEQGTSLTRSRGGTETMIGTMRRNGRLRPDRVPSGLDSSRRLSFRRLPRRRHALLRASAAPCEKTLLGGGGSSPLAEFRYDKKSGKPTMVKDRLGNSRYLEYDADGNCVKLTRRAAWEWKRKPVRSFAYDRAGRLAAVSELDADGGRPSPRRRDARPKRVSPVGAFRSASSIPSDESAKRGVGAFDGAS